jgi:hypothetical protein
MSEKRSSKQLEVKAMGKAQDNKQSDFFSNARAYSKMIYDGVNGLKNLQNQFNYGGYGPGGPNPLPPGIGENDGITSAEVSAVVFDTADALSTTLNSGHGANIEKLL